MSPTRGDVTAFWSRYWTCPRCWRRVAPPRRSLASATDWCKCPRCHRIWNGREREEDER